MPAGRHPGREVCGGLRTDLEHIMSDYLRSYLELPDEMSKISLPRTGARPLVGEVCCIGSGSVAGTGTTLRVHILRRQRGGYIVYREHLTIWEGSSDTRAAVLCATPDDVLQELGGDQMRSAEEDAWEQAVKKDAALAAINQVDI